MDALKQALGRMNENAGGGESGGGAGEEASSEHAGGSGGGGLHAVHHMSHGNGKHSVHKVHHDGKSESSMHGEGEDQTCPLCGK